MSQENVEIIRKLNEAFNRDGMGADAAVGFFDADAVFEEPPEQPSPTVAEGLDAVIRTFKQFDEAWEEHRSDLEEIRVIDDERVLMLSIEHFRGREGIELAQPCGTVFTLRDGRVTRMQPFWERENALRAAGLLD
jgi:ketosteroid isomerase-like protein